MKGPLGRALHSALEFIIFVHLVLLLQLDGSLLLFFFRTFLHALQNTFVRAHSLRFSSLFVISINAFIASGRVSCLSVLCLLYDKHVNPSLTIDFCGGWKNVSTPFLLYMDAILTMLQLIRGIMIPLNNSKEIILSGPFVYYIPGGLGKIMDKSLNNNDQQEEEEEEDTQTLFDFNVQNLSDPRPRYVASLTNPNVFLPIDEPNELETCPTFHLDLLGFSWGIVFGMATAGFSPPLDLQQQNISDIRTSFRWRLIRLNRTLRQSSFFNNLRLQR